MTTDATKRTIEQKGNGELPSGWRMVEFGDVVKDVKEAERSPLDHGMTKYVGLEHIEPEELQINDWGSLADDEVSFTKVFRKGQVLFGKRRAYQRKVALANFDGICSSDILTFAAKDELNPDLLPFIVQSDGFFDHALDTSSGSLSPRTRWSQLKDYRFPLPPPNVQLARAAILWASEAAINSYSHLIDSMSVLRRSLINFEVQPQKQISSEWLEKTFGDLVAEKVLAQPQDGNHGNDHPTASDYVDCGIPFIMANNVRDHLIDVESCKFIPKTLGDTLRIGFSYTDDVLLTHKGTIGEVAIVPPLATEYIMLTPQVTYYRVTAPSALDRDFLYYSLQADFIQRKLLRWSAQSTRAYVGITAQRKLPIRIPPIEVQEAVVHRVRRLDEELKGVAAHLALLRKSHKRLLNALTGGPHDI